MTVDLDVLSLIFLKYQGYVFGYVLYPFVIFKTGAFRGGIMTILSFLVCLFLLKLYDSSRRDWLGIEAVKTSQGL